MKIYVKAEREFSDRAKQFQSKLDNKRQRANMRNAYVDQLNSTARIALEDTLRDKLFLPIIQDSSIMDKVYSFSKYAKERISSGSYGVDIDFIPKDNCIVCSVDPYFPPSRYHKGLGLLWLADIVSGGLGTKTEIYLSSMPARMKRQMHIYLNIIADALESRGFEILADPKGNSYGKYNIPITCPEYDELIEK